LLLGGAWGVGDVGGGLLGCCVCGWPQLGVVRIVVGGSLDVAFVVGDSLEWCGLWLAAAWMLPFVVGGSLEWCGLWLAAA
jgi:hypothetical protein